MRSETLVPLGAQLKRLRLERGWSQQALGRKADVNGKYLGLIERGRSDVGVLKLVNLARALSVPIATLLETITPERDRVPRLSPADKEELSTAARNMKACVDRIVSGKPHPLPKRAPRRSRRRR